jgi:hypothetical protein
MVGEPWGILYEAVGICYASAEITCMPPVQGQAEMMSRIAELTQAQLR